MKGSSIIREFVAFLREYSIVALAIGFIIGIASNDLVRSFVDNVLMPLVNPLVPADRWQDATLTIGPVVLGWGSFTAELLRFVILALLVFFVVKKILRWEKMAQ